MYIPSLNLNLIFISAPLFSLLTAHPLIDRLPLSPPSSDVSSPLRKSPLFGHQPSPTAHPLAARFYEYPDPRTPIQPRADPAESGSAPSDLSTPDPSIDVPGLDPTSGSEGSPVIVTVADRGLCGIIASGGGGLVMHSEDLIRKIDRDPEYCGRVIVETELGGIAVAVCGVGRSLDVEVEVEVEIEIEIEIEDGDGDGDDGGDGKDINASTSV